MHSPTKSCSLDPIPTFLVKECFDIMIRRPVSGLGFISKVVQHIVVSQLKSHLAAKNLDNMNQSAYKVGHSTETGLLKIKNYISLNLAQIKPTALILLNLSAFDTIHHSQL